MATNMMNHQQSIEEMVTCPICMERMESPKHLTCQHAFCMACLEDWTKQPGNSSRSISCPVCRKNTHLDSGVHNLPTDINVIRLIDVLNANMQSCSLDSAQSSQFTPTSGSESKNCAHDNSPAVGYCETCLEHLCTRCMKIHKQEPALSNHFVRSTLHNCPLHAKKLLDFFCPRCKKLVCGVCVHGPHKKHGSQPIAVVAKRNKEVIRKMRTTLADRIAVERQRHFSQGSEGNVDTALVEMESLVANHVAKNSRSIETWQTGILGEINQKRDEYRQQMSMIENQLVECESLVTYADYFLQPDTKHEVVASFPNIRSRLDQAEKSLATLEASTRVQKLKEIIFVAEPIAPSLGRLTTAADLEKEQQNPRKSPSPTETFRTPTCSPTGNAGLYPNINQGEAFPFGSASAPDIRTFDMPHIPRLVKYGLDLMDENWCNTDFSFTVKMHNEEHIGTSFGQAAVGFMRWMSGSGEEDLFSPVDVAVDNNRGYMYILNRGWFTAGTIKRYDLPGDYTMRYGKVVMNEVSAYALGVCQNDGTIVASVKERLYAHIRGVIPSKRQAGDIIPVEQLFPHTVRYPRGIAISDNNIWVIVDNTYSVVAIYELEGSAQQFKHVITFGSVGSGPGQFKSPTSVCCDSVRDRIIVSDSGNHRIQAFSMKGEFLWSCGGKGSSQGEFLSPRGVCMDGAGNILVADTGNKRIAIISLEDGAFLKSISTNIVSMHNLSPFTIALHSPMHGDVAYIVIAGLTNRMPVISMLKYTRDRSGLRRGSSRDYYFVDDDEDVW